MNPYYQDDSCTIYHGDYLDLADAWAGGDVVVTDPPYGETNLSWDKWPERWPAIVATCATNLCQMWCFGSTRMFLGRRDDFADWRLAQDIVWSKPRGRSMTTDRFSRSHELVLHWYRGGWNDLYRAPPRIPYFGSRIRATRRGQSDDGTRVKPHAASGVYLDDNTRLMLTVIAADPGDPRTTLHPTQKPLGVLMPIIKYSCPLGGIVVDLFMGSGSTLRAAKDLGRKAIGIEIDERYCEIAARRLGQEVLAL